MSIRKGFVDLVGNTPLVRLNKASEATGCEILGKAEFLNPGSSVKDRAALFMIKDAVEKGRFHHQWLPDAISFEYQNFSPETLVDLEKRGHSYYFRRSIGEANCILYDYENKIFYASGDSRRRASAKAY